MSTLLPRLRRLPLQPQPRGLFHRGVVLDGCQLDALTFLFLKFRISRVIGLNALSLKKPKRTRRRAKTTKPANRQIHQRRRRLPRWRSIQSRLLQPLSLRMTPSLSRRRWLLTNRDVVGIDLQIDAVGSVSAGRRHFCSGGASRFSRSNGCSHLALRTVHR